MLRQVIKQAQKYSYLQPRVKIPRLSRHLNAANNHSQAAGIFFVHFWRQQVAEIVTHQQFVMEESVGEAHL